MNGMHALERQIAAVWPPETWCDVKVLVAVSGGPDSVALLRALVRLADQPGPRLVAAHYNHRWRGEQSDADEAFVRQLCASLVVPCHVGRADERRPGKTGGGLESAAREARYAFLVETARQVGARYVATAHTADDQVETVLHRLLRGTGIGGLAGIPRLRSLVEGVTLIRPLLDVRREDVSAYLASLEQPYRRDASNLDSSFTRVRIRRELLPQLRDTYNPQVDEALLRLARLAEEAQRVIDERIDPLVASAVCAETDGVGIDCAALAGASPHLVREFCIAVWKLQGWPQQGMGFEKWDELAALAQADVPPRARRDFPGGVSALRENGRLTLSCDAR